MNAVVENKEAVEAVNAVEMDATATKTKKAPRKGKKTSVANADAEPTLILRIPSLKTDIRSTLWARHVYQVYHELIPSHLTSEPVIKAYNAFVDCLASHHELLETFIPRKSERYQQGLVFEKLTFQRYMDGSIPGRFKNENELWRQPALIEEHKRIVEDIKAAYKVLYDLVKGDLVPILRKKQQEENVKKRIPIVRGEIECVERTMEQERKRHERALAHEQAIHANRMKDYQEMLQRNVSELRELLTPTDSCAP